jgi:hypothetical protein
MLVLQNITSFQASPIRMLSEMQQAFEMPGREKETEEK